MSPEKLWSLSRALNQRGYQRVARLVSACSFSLYKCLLPPDVDVQGPVRFMHHATGVVIHPNTLIQGKCRIFHGVTIGGEDSIGGAGGVTIEPDVCIYTGALIIPRRGERLVVGRGARIGAGAVVTRSVPPCTIVAGNPAQPIGTCAGKPPF